MPPRLTFRAGARKVSRPAGARRAPFPQSADLPMFETPALLEDAWSLLSRGGPVMMILLALSVLAVAIILVKLLQFSRAQLRRTAFIDPAVADLARGERDRALSTLRREINPVARVMETAISANANANLSVEDRDAEIERVGTSEIRGIESYLRGLEVIANVSPLLGLLGTVLGMIGAFAKLESAGSKVDPAILAGGIWEALLTTAFGLIVAIPALTMFYVLEGRVDEVRATMKDTVVRILSLTGAAPRPMHATEPEPAG